jgi:hypothetical protein
MNTRLSNPRQTPIPGNGCKGSSPGVYIDRVTCKGVALEKDEPYAAKDKDKCPIVTRFPSGVTNWASVPADERSFAQAMTHNPFVIAVSADKEFKAYSKGALGCKASKTKVNHAVAAMAYAIAPLASYGGWSSRWEAAGRAGAGLSAEKAPQALRITILLPCHLQPLCLIMQVILETTFLPRIRGAKAGAPMGT